MSDKILIVDDETEIADLIEMFLNNENYTVYKFYSAKEALACIETTELDLAILDIMLPDIDGSNRIVGFAVIFILPNPVKQFFCADNVPFVF